MMKLLKGFAKGFPLYIRKWDEPTVREFGGIEVEGRPTRAFGTSVFNYAGKVYRPDPWEERWEVDDLKYYLEERLEVDFNFCLCGLYKTGAISVPHHSDTVPTLEDVVVGVSFGAPRVLEWRQYENEIKKETNTSKTAIGTNWTFETTRYFLEDGDVYMFDGHSQMTSTHSVPTLEGVGERSSLTFRTGL